MIVDCHTHIGRNKHINASVDELLRSMDNAGIDKSLVFAGKLNDCPNDYLMQQISPHKDRLHGVACVHPDDTPEEDAYICRLMESKAIKAIKFYLGYDHWYPNDRRIYDLLRNAEEYGITAIFHCGDCLCTVKKAKLKYAHPLGIDDVAVDFSKLKIVIAHMGYPWHRDAAEVCYKNDNVWADISGFVYGGFNRDDCRKFTQVLNEFVDVADQGKLLFGSDWPISNQRSYVNMIHGLWDTKSANIHSLDFLVEEGADHVFNLGIEKGRWEKAESKIIK